MKPRNPLLLSLLAAGTALLAAPLLAQNQPPMPPQPAPASTAPAPGGAATSMAPPQAMPPPANPPQGQPPPAQGQASQGQPEIHSSMPPAAPESTPPDFSQLSNGGKSISEEQAATYPPLANDFIHADRNRDGKISKSEYTRWTQQK
ncbi:hypothetical protein [Frateuria defendens]|uniref:hypothetical protein n=1 Tax=Frateuria defendens TaxID=2219559 RepID=UPI00066FF3CC|nr:hypothetical protein [Frateuria defendens]